MPTQYRTADLTRRAFARTNLQTIAQRVALLQEMLPALMSIAEICCGDCFQQAAAYRQHLGVKLYQGLDIQPEMVAANRAQGIDCLCGDALDPEVLRQFLEFEVIFFGPPLSVDCDGHQLLTFREVIPSYADFIGLLKKPVKPSRNQVSYQDVHVVAVGLSKAGAFSLSAKVM